MNKLLVRAAVAGAGVASTLLGTVAISSTALAAQPAVRACLGASVSAGAQLFHPYGQVVLAPNTPTGPFGKVSDAVHAIQAGLVPDSIYPNTCND
jgi:hypothetical protein